MYAELQMSPDLARELTWVLGFFSFWFGACIASFLNVVVWRVPRGESIVSPPSHCPKCGSSIKWWQNVPILSWLALRGKCANCHAPISPRYILVELLGGVLFLAVFLAYNPLTPISNLNSLVTLSASVVVMWIWVSLMIAGSFIDFDHQLLPDFVTVGGMVLGVAFHTLLGVWKCVKTWNCGVPFCWEYARFCFGGVAWSVFGLAFGFGLLWLVRWLGSKAFRREAMGMGDVFLMGAVGAIFGPAAVVVTLMVSCILGSVVGLAMIAMSKAKFGKFVAIPFGPYICLGCLAWMFFGEQMLRWYTALIGLGRAA